MMRTIGIELEYANVRPITLKPLLPEGWETLGDRSIVNTDGSCSRYGKMDVLGAEIRSAQAHPLSWYTNGTLSEVLSLARDLGGKPNRYCGLHVHIGSFEATKKMLLFVAEYFHRNSVAELAHTTAGRMKKQCKPIDHDLLNDFRNKDLDQLKELCNAYEDEQHNYFRQREVNALSLLKFGTIEYRMFASTFNESQVLAAIDWCLALTDACLNGRDIPLPRGALPPPVNER